MPQTDPLYRPAAADGLLSGGGKTTSTSRLASSRRTTMTVALSDGKFTASAMMGGLSDSVHLAHRLHKTFGVKRFCVIRKIACARTMTGPRTTLRA